MPRAIWSGAISFGLVNIPVKLYSAVRDTRVHFHRLHAEDHARVRNQMVCEAEGEVLEPADVVKGYEVSPDEYVVVEDEELEALEPKATRAIEISDFIDLSEIDPVYYSRPYYLVPDEEAMRPYTLLVKALSESGKAGIGKLVMRGKEYLAAIRPVDGVVLLETMHFADEVVEASEIGELPSQPEPNERELAMAKELIGALTSEFEPGRYRDTYREAVLQLVQDKAEGREPVVPKPAEEPGKVIDIMSALEASLSRAREEKAGAGEEKAGAGEEKAEDREAERERGEARGKASKAGAAGGKAGKKPGKRPEKKAEKRPEKKVEKKPERRKKAV